MLIPKENTNCSMILVLGATGSGKSYFVNKLAEGSVLEGPGLHSTTERCEVVRVNVGGSEVAIVDTPGFDDTVLSDAEVLERIVEFLCAQYAIGIPLKGIIYMHRITDNKMSGSAQRYFEMFQSLCGEKNLGNVFLLTTMWSEIRDRGKGMERERELRKNFWNVMESKGSTIRSFDGSRSMAEGFVCRLMRMKDIVLDIQEELVEQGMRLEETKAGKLLVPGLERQIGESGERILELSKVIDKESASGDVDIRRLERQQGTLLEQRQKEITQRQRLQKRTGRVVAEKVKENETRDKLLSRLAMFGSLVGLVITATVNVILPLAGVIAF